jgi:hypothetical protein
VSRNAGAGPSSCLAQTSLLAWFQGVLEAYELASSPTPVALPPRNEEGLA